MTLPAGTQAVPSTIPHSGSSSISGSSSVASNEELIRRQQAEIEQLKRSLEVSQSALKEQQMALQLTQQNNEQIILSQQLRNNQVKKLFRRRFCQILIFTSRKAGQGMGIIQLQLQLQLDLQLTFNSPTTTYYPHHQNHPNHPYHFNFN